MNVYQINEYNKILSWYYSLTKVDKPRHDHNNSLRRMSLLLQLLNNPQKNYKKIHVTGTSGKGSVSRFIASIFETSRS